MSYIKSSTQPTGTKQVTNLSALPVHIHTVGVIQWPVPELTPA
jgi:hypothetical protein